MGWKEKCSDIRASFPKHNAGPDSTSSAVNWVTIIIVDWSETGQAAQHKPGRSEIPVWFLSPVWPADAFTSAGVLSFHTGVRVTVLGGVILTKL